MWVSVAGPAHMWWCRGDEQRPWRVRAHGVVWACSDVKWRAESGSTERRAEGYPPDSYPGGPRGVVLVDGRVTMADAVLLDASN